MVRSIQGLGEDLEGEEVRTLEWEEEEDQEWDGEVEVEEA